MARNVAHGFGAGDHVGLDAVCQAAKFIGCDVKPLFFVVAVDELCMFIALAGVGIDEGESGVKVGSCFCYLGGEFGQMVLDNDVGSVRAGLGMVGLGGVKLAAALAAMGVA
jgi:hypothetical protein